MEKTRTHTPIELSPDRLLFAVLLCIAAHFSFAVMGASAKALSEHYHVAEIAFWRNLMLVIPFFFFIVLGGKTHLFKTKKPVLLGMRALSGGISIITAFTALSALPISYTTVIFYTSSIITPVMAFFFLKEKIGHHRWTAVIIGMCGVLIIAQPSGSISYIGLIAGICTAFIHASNFIMLRGLKSESPVTITFYFFLAGTIIPALFLPWVAHGIAPAHYMIFGLIALSAGTGQLTITTAYRYAPASFITPFMYTSLIWSILIDIYIWNFELDYISIAAGASLIIFAQLYIGWREYKNSKT